MASDTHLVLLGDDRGKNPQGTRGGRPPYEKVGGRRGSKPHMVSFFHGGAPNLFPKELRSSPFQEGESAESIRLRLSESLPTGPAVGGPLKTHQYPSGEASA